MQLLPRRKSLLQCCNHCFKITGTQDRQAGHGGKLGYHCEKVTLAEVLLLVSLKSVSLACQYVYFVVIAVTECLKQRTSVETRSVWLTVLDVAAYHRERVEEPLSS